MLRPNVNRTAAKHFAAAWVAARQDERGCSRRFRLRLRRRCERLESGVFAASDALDMRSPESLRRWRSGAALTGFDVRYIITNVGRLFC